LENPFVYFLSATTLCFLSGPDQGSNCIVTRDLCFAGFRELDDLVRNDEACFSKTPGEQVSSFFLLLWEALGAFLLLFDFWRIFGSWKAWCENEGCIFRKIKKTRSLKIWESEASFFLF